ncbi:MAG: SdpI family protein [Gemmatimonadetes bacterium]|nr:SdpI family protein [Gemmatimonadota bacterium]
MMRSRWFGYVVAVVAAALSVWAYPQLPPEVATHWNVRGEPDGFSSRFWAVTALPAGILALRGVVAILPSIDPKGANYPKFVETYRLIFNGVLGFMLLVHVVIMANGVGYPVRVDRITVGGIGLLLVLIGNYLGRVEPNWFVGIRTPWTLSSDRVWRRTHRLGAWILVAGGSAIVLTVFLPAATMPIVIGLLAVVAVVPVVVSYLLWKREQRVSGS